MQKQIHQYVKKKVNGSTRIVGILVGCIDETEVVHFGWSKTAVTKGDKFNKERGFEIANGRVIHSMNNIAGKVLPHSMKEDNKRFVERCKRYFKNGKFRK